MAKPTDQAILERSLSLANEAIYTVSLQRRRVRSLEPEDEPFVLRWWADLQFLVTALRRLRQIVTLASCVPQVSGGLLRGLEEFDNALPGLSTMRNVGEHLDVYAIDDRNRRHKQVDRHMVQTGTWDGTTYEWLKESLNVDKAYDAATKLYLALRTASGLA